MEMHDLAVLARKVIWVARYRTVVEPALLRRKAPADLLLTTRKWPSEILGGPFVGMKYLREATGSAFLPKILGSYESYLYPWISDVVRSRPSKVFIVGCAEGYYACGLKKLLPETSVLAFDIDAGARELCRRLAEMNALEIDIQGNFSPLEHVLDGAMILMDVEGAEYHLLAPDVAARYAKASLIIEAHDHIFGFGDNTNRIIATFSSTHRIDLIPHADRGAAEASVISAMNLTAAESQAATDELRAGKNNWLRLTPI